MYGVAVANEGGGGAAVTCGSRQLGFIDAARQAVYEHVGEHDAMRNDAHDSPE